MTKQKTKRQIVAEVMEDDPDSLCIGLQPDYFPSPGECDNLVYPVCKYTCSWPMRQADLHICLQMAGDLKGPAGITRLTKTACEYVWDHICGEPSDTSPEKFFAHMKPMLEEWYSKTTPEDRAKIK